MRGLKPILMTAITVILVIAVANRIPAIRQIMAG